MTQEKENPKIDIAKIQETGDAKKSMNPLRPAVAPPKDPPPSPKNPHPTTKTEKDK